MRTDRGRWSHLASILLVAALGACAPMSAEDAPDPSAAPASGAEESSMDLVQRGEHLVAIMDCDACHTPKVMTEAGPVPDLSRRLSGHPADEPLSAAPALPEGWMAATNAHQTAWAGPWGISYASNLTPHEATGIAIWTDEMFIGAIREGRHMGTSRQILPPMPWQAYQALPDEDLRAILAFLKSLPPIDNQVPEPTPPESRPADD